jgi:glycosyltransferase involved in cell wall biosynthesis
LPVIPQFGVEQDVFSPVARAARGYPLVIGMAGRLVPEKGTDMLLRVLAGIDADWKLQIVGSGPQRKRLDELADKLRIASRIDFLPWRPSSEMPDFYRGLDLLIVPSLTRPNWKEQFGRVLVEAMACGIPVVGSDSGEIPNVIGDAGIIVPEGNVDALSAAIRSLIADEERRVELGRRARRRVLDHYTQDRIAALTVDAYRSIA